MKSIDIQNVNITVITSGAYEKEGAFMHNFRYTYNYGWIWESAGYCQYTYYDDSGVFVTPEEVSERVNNYIKSGIQPLIIDSRNNEYFLATKKVIIKEDCVLFK